MGGKRPNYIRDVWILGPQSSECPGAFPNGFVRLVKKRWWGQRRLWVCSGGFHDNDGIMLDIRKQMRPTITADAQFLPFRDDSFDFVLADPPYSKQEAADLYGTDYPSALKVVCEGVRVTKPGGHFMLFHRLVPGHEARLPKNMKLVACIGVAQIANWSNIRALTVFEKTSKIDADWGFGYDEAALSPPSTHAQ